MQQLVKQLEASGLSEKEAALYVATLSLGIASIADIARRAGIKRPTAYLVIETLIQKKLLAQIPHGKKIHYKAESPETLLADLTTKRENTARAMPDLLTLFRQSSVVPKIRFYEGKQGLFHMYEEIFRSNEIWGIFSPEKYARVITEDEQRHFMRLLDRQGGIIHDLCEDTPATRRFLGTPYRKGLSEDRLLPKGMKVATDILVYSHTVAIVSLETLVGVVIEDKAIAQTQKMFIEELWHKAERA